MRRESGFYWVKYSNKWIVAEWEEENESWYLPGRSAEISTGCLSEVDERKITKP